MASLIARPIVYRFGLNFRHPGDSLAQKLMSKSTGGLPNGEVSLLRERLMVQRQAPICECGVGRYLTTFD